MTKPEQTARDADQSDGAVIIKRAVLGFGGGLVLIFLVGMIAGFIHGVMEHGGPGVIGLAMFGAMVLASLAVGYGIWRFWPRTGDEPVAPRIKSARMILIAMTIIGIPLGVLIGMSDDGAASFLSNGPVSPLLAMAAIALWLIPVPVLTWLWWQRVDEHEANAYRDGGLIAVHGYIFLAPAWWMATRAKWLPPQDPMIMLLMICLIWTAGWFVKRYL